MTDHAVAPRPAGSSRVAVALAVVAVSLAAAILAADFDETGLLVRPGPRVGRGPQPVARPPGAVGPWAATPEGFDAALASVRDALARCDTALEGAAPQAPVVATMRVTSPAGGAGRVAEVAVEGASGPSPVAECVFGAVGDLEFTGAPPGDVLVRFAVPAAPPP